MSQQLKIWALPSRPFSPSGAGYSIHVLPIEEQALPILSAGLVEQYRIALIPPSCLPTTVIVFIIIASENIFTIVWTYN